MCADYDNLTKAQKSFIGSKFTTQCGGTLLVKDFSHLNNNHVSLFILECSICSEDVELWPYGSLVASKSSLVSGRSPCGCSKSPKWTERQNRIRVQRASDNRGYIFHGWFDCYKGSCTYLDLENPKTGNRWNTTRMGNFFNGRGDPVEARKNTTDAVRSDERMISSFKDTGAFLEGTTFLRNNIKCTQGFYGNWSYTCPVCSKDDYVREGLCSGVFHSWGSSLKQGHKSCRCSKTYRWSQEQREYQITKVCKEEGLTFLRWVGKWRQNKSKFEWQCRNEHKCKTSISNFIKGCRCYTCFVESKKQQGNFYGYYPDRVDERDYLYIVNFDDQYLKIGRSFDVDRRLIELSRQSGINLQNISILCTMTSTHGVVYPIEQWLHKELTFRGFHYKDKDWSVELFSLDSIGTVYTLLSRTPLIQMNTS